MQPTAVMREDRKLAYRLLFDLLLFVIALIPILIYEFAVEPFRRGFFCNDQSIQYPFRGNTVTEVDLGLLVGLLPILIFILVELVRFYQRGRMDESILLFGFKTPTWLAECSRQIAYFAFGLALTFDATEVGKYTIGRLRPHFMAVCQPQLADGTTCNDPINWQRYIEDYVCVPNGFTALDVRQGRLSFPSGHSSMTFYAFVYVSLYIQSKFRWNGSKLLRHFVQFVLISLAWFTALSRVMDNWHHWSDVLAGSLIGVLAAIITALYISKLFHKPETGLKLSIPRQDTSATLQDVISTPPPYTLNTVNSFTNEQYCTKV